MSAPDSRPQPVLDRRRAGVLLHPTALAGEGALGAAGRRFIDWLAEAGFSVWQVLPLGPVGPDGSPYWVHADSALNPLLIDRHEAADPAQAPQQFAMFCAAQAQWLEDYVLFEALAAAQGTAAWRSWPPALRDREPGSLAAARAQLADELQRLRIEQWQADMQWQQMRAHAHMRGVRLFGDLPIYVAPDSVSTWSQRVQFQLDAAGQPRAVAGVPPDYFSADGQLWGNPLYDWEQARRDGFAFWRARLGVQLQRFDLVRIDHFRALAAYWAVPADAATARDGHWRPAPGRELLQALQRQYGEVPLVAEDLGLITPDVDELRREFRLPGMRVLQFGFDGSPDNPHLPHNLQRDTVLYTGTHDNDTTLGWYRSLPPAIVAHVDAYLRSEAQAMPRSLCAAALASVAQLAILPLQDLLALDSRARFNTPGTVSGNWQWRAQPQDCSAALAAELRALNRLYGRLC